MNRNISNQRKKQNRHRLPNNSLFFTIIIKEKGMTVYVKAEEYSTATLNKLQMHLRNVIENSSKKFFRNISPCIRSIPRIVR